MAVEGKEKHPAELCWWSSGYDSMLPLQGASVRSLVWQLRVHVLGGVAKRSFKKKKLKIFLGFSDLCYRPCLPDFLQEILEPSPVPRR